MGTALLSIGVRAMAASYAQMQTTSHNIANAGVEGYSRQRTMLATSQGQFTGMGYFGRGVDVVGVQRIQDAFLTREAAGAKALSSMDATRSERLAQLEQVFRTGEQGIGHSVTQFFAALSDLASRPADGATREVVLARAQDMTRRFNDAGEQISLLQRNVNLELQASVAQVNGLASSIAKVNNDIAAQRGMGQEPNDLLDERDQLISRLSDFVQVTTIAADDGTLGVFIGGGQRLVLGNVAERLELTPDLFDGSRSGVSMSEGASLRPLSSDALGAGSMAGLLAFQDQDLSAAAARVGQLARAVAETVNEQQQLGLNLQPPAGSVPSAALFGFAQSTLEQVLPAGTNQKNGSGQFFADVSIEVVDARQLKGVEYELRVDPGNASQWQVIRVPDDGTPAVDVADGSQVDGFVIHFNVAPVAGERFRLQPVTRAAGGMQRLLTDPLDLAAASPFVASTPSTNTGTVAVSGLRMVATPSQPQGGATITFTGPDPLDGRRMLYDWEQRDSGGAIVATGSGTWTPGKPLPSLPDVDINGWEIDIAGVPAIGDQLEVAVTPYPALNNGNALALQRMGTLSLVGVTELATGEITGGLSFNESFVAALADVGVRAQGARAAAEISAARASQAEQARASKAGVNLDEEAARLIQQQQGYQAAAKVLQIAQQVFAELLKTAG